MSASGQPSWPSPGGSRGRRQQGAADRRLRGGWGAAARRMEWSDRSGTPRCGSRWWAVCPRSWADG